MANSIHCVITPDVAPWEREGLEPLLTAMAARCELRVTRISSGGDRGALFSSRPDAAWVLCKDWKRAIDYLRVSRCDFPVYLSALGSLPARSLPAVLVNYLFGKPPRNVHLVTHSPTSFRFYRELARLRPERVHLLPLPAVSFGDSRPVARPLVGTFTALSAGCHLNFFLSVAHYVAQKRPDAVFTVLGRGPLDRHVGEMIRELGLTGRVSLRDCDSLAALSDLSVFLFVALQSEHFLPLLAAGALRIPPLCIDVPGIEEIVHDGHTGFVVEVNDTKPMGELVLRLLSDDGLRQAIGRQLCETLRNKYSASELAPRYLDLFSGVRASEIPPATSRIAS